VSSEDRQSARHALHWAAAIFLLSFAVRLIALWLVSDAGIHFSKYLVLAERLRDNHLITPGAFAYSPLYLYFLAILLTFTAGATLPILVVQILLGSFAATVAYYVTRKLATHRTAVIAGLLFALSHSMVLHEVSFLADALVSLLELLLLAALLRGIEQPTLRRWAVCGLILGLATVLRPNVALALVGLLPALWLLLRSLPVRQRLARAGVLVGVMIAVVLPTTIQNAAVSDDFVPVLSTGGYVFYASNNYASSAVRHAPPPLALTIADAPTHNHEDPVLFWDDTLSARIANSWTSRDLKPSEVSGFYVRKALESVGRYPGYFFKLMIRKALGVVSTYEVHDTAEATAKRDELEGFPLFPYGIIFCLGVVGILVTRQSWRRLLPMYVLAATQLITLLVFYATPRYRLPLEAIFALFAALAVGWFLEASRRRALRYLGVLVILLLVSYVPRTDVMRQIERDRAIQSALAEGEVHALTGEYDSAIEALERVIHLVDNPASPLLPNAHRQLADLYQRSGDPGKAMEESENAQPPTPLKQAQLLSLKIQDQGASPRFLCLMANIYRETGRWSDAKDYCAGALDLAPQNPVTRYRLAEIQLALGELAAAVSNLEQALQDGLDFSRFGPLAHYQLWNIYLEHDPDVARTHRQAFRRLSWIFEYLKPTLAEAQAMDEMDLPNPWNARP
jgi:tetratricopeptide (TPR) repeat protein